MDNPLHCFLDNTRVSTAALESRLTHPITQIRYPTRLAFDLLKQYAGDYFTAGYEPRLIGLAGLRGVGKTTLLWQVANQIYHHHHPDIYFFNGNTLKNLGIALHAALDEFQRHILRKRFNELSEPITLLFDEVHDDEQWSTTLKILYDEARTAFILCTGSSALLINQTADLARRMRVEKIYPYKWTEFIAAKACMERNGQEVHPEAGLSSRLKEALFYSDTPEAAFTGLKELEPTVQNFHQKIQSTQGLPFEDLLSGYLSHQNLPNFLFYRDAHTVNDSILDLFKRVIREDIPRLNPGLTDFTKIERLLLRLAGSDEINPEKLAGILGMPQKDLNERIDLLAKAELLNVIPPFGGLDTKIAKNKKAFFMSPSLRGALLSSVYGQNLPDPLKSKLLEDLIVLYLRQVVSEGFVTYLSGKEGVNADFVIETRNLPLLLEIGTRKTSVRQLTKSKTPSRYGVLISRGITAPTLKGSSIQIPLYWFLCL